ncbi:secretion protein EccC [Mycobacterium sp. IS-1496]|uniref:type VII secretion protein EccCa n=1 Tax=Mycobacterium sp. IS-1496 TaxID=1772284 RepID=UPI000741529C|nr:type VII secretion protein EccCa [Mycobacterium sp. IS-1496]KUI33959.1 secretion protein EccC [Mycobacterium sp. IS-1496]
MDIAERMPRTGEFALDAPPPVPRPAGGHPLARLMPFAMLIAAGGMMLLYFTSGAGQPRSPMAGLFPVMMAMSLVGSLVFGARGAQRGVEVERNRRDYLRYLDGVDRAVAGSARRQYDDGHHLHPAPETLWAIAGSARMWERTVGEDDFGCVRVGLGRVPLTVRLVAPEVGHAEDADPVTVEAMRTLVRDRSTVEGAPLTVKVTEPGLIGVTGDLTAGRDLIRAAVCQLVALQGPGDVSVRAASAPPVAGEWEWLKWLPHHRSSGGHALVIADGVPPPVAAPGVTVWCLGEPQRSAVTVRVECGELTIRDRTGDERAGRPDGLTIDQAAACARRVAASAGAVAETPVRGGPRNWQDLLGIADPTTLDPAAAWRSHAPNRFLRVPIGLSDNGTPVELDLKEAAHHGMGPHGLCVGATGSGKSELLRTLTLGLIASHPPDALNLILVDFKGGATFLGLERAAHVSAVITNLDQESHLVARMRDALAGEMHRRQQLLRTAGNVANIADYRQAQASRPELVALPVLLIVVDEFSELLTQHPDFAELFLAIGRVGRSLGMHLLLASQRLDEGRLRGLDTHLSYRICLKTFSAGESRAVLGVGDAHELPNTPGLGYLKTASGDMVRFRTAFVSGPVAAGPAPSAEHLTPRLFTASSPESDRPAPGACASAPTVLDTVVDRLAGLGTPAHRVWLPPLSGPPALDAVLSRAPSDRAAPLTVPIGLVDCPFEQRRDLFSVALGGAAGNVAVIGGPRSGKSMTLRTLMLALAATNDPHEVQFYGLDLGGGALAAMSELPHVGAVAGRQDPDLIRRIVAECESLVRIREKRFRRGGIESISEYRRRRAAGDPATGADPYGEVFLVVDGWSVLRRDFEQLEPSITALAVQGLAYGVHVILAASRWADLRPALKDQLGTRIELRLGDPAESEMDRKRARQLTDGAPGRGLTHDGRETVVAVPRLDGRPTADGLAAALAAAAETLRTRYGHRGAPPIAPLPTLVHRHELATVESPTQVAIGVAENGRAVATLDFATQPHLIVLGDVECGKTAALRALCTSLTASSPPDAVQLLLVDFRRTLLGVVESDHLAGYVMAEAGLTAAVPELIERFAARMPGAGVTQRQLRDRSWWTGPETYVVIDDYDLVAGATALTPLLAYLPHARDIGLHVIVARRSGGAARAMFDPLLARLRDLGAMGMMMSAGPEEGVLLGSVRSSVLAPGRATLITRGATDQLIQVAWTEPP